MEVAGSKQEAALANPVPPAFATRKKTTVLVPVDIDSIKAIEARGGAFLPPEHPRGVPDDLLLCPALSQEHQDMRDAFAELAEEMKALSDKETAILEQYRKYGYAYEEIEVDDVEA